MSTSIRYVGKTVEAIKGGRAEQSVAPKFTVDEVRSFGPVFGFLNDKDRDILYLIFVSCKKQKEVQAVLERSQPSLCYDIKRIRRRLKFIFYLHSVSDIFINFLLFDSEEFSDAEKDILTLMFYTSSFTMAAKVLGVSQVMVRYAYDKCIVRMQEMEMWGVYEIFTMIRDNLNIIRRVYGEFDPESSEVVIPLSL